MTLVAAFKVRGTPRTAGSKRAYLNKYTKRAQIADSSGAKGKAWRTDVQDALRKQYHGAPVHGPVRVVAVFFFRRPKAHYRTGRNAHLLKESAPQLHTQKPDLSKLVRAVEDALTHWLWLDDAQVCALDVRKQWSSKFEGAIVSVHKET